MVDPDIRREVLAAVALVRASTDEERYDLLCDLLEVPYPEPEQQNG